MLVPEEFRCCVCLSTSERALLTGCPHRICADCAESGGLSSCPVCRADLPAERPLDAAFARRVGEAALQCGCGATVPVLQAEAHACEQTRKRKRPGGLALPPAAAGRRPPPPAPNRSTFACPLCDERNLTPQGLIEHCERAHVATARGPIAAVCPICASMPWGDPTYVSRDFLSHLRLRHRCDYTVLTDFEADEDAMFRRALRDSLRTAGFEAQLEEEERILAQVLEQSAREASSSDSAGSESSAGASGAAGAAGFGGESPGHVPATAAA